MRLALAAVVGVATGFLTGNAYLGFQAGALTYGLSGALDPKQKVLGPRLDDLKAPQASYGAPIAYVEGSPRLAGCVIYAGEKREISHTHSVGKGGPGVSSTTFTYEENLLYELAINQCAGIRRVFSNGKLVWNSGVDADDETLQASEETPIWRDMRFYSGAPDQLPDPTYEAAVGVGNAPAYRGRTTVFIEGLNLGNSGQLPVLTFEIATSSSPPAGGRLVGYNHVAIDYRKCGPIFVGPDGIDMHVLVWGVPYTPSGVIVTRTSFSGKTLQLASYDNGVESPQIADSTGAIDESAFLQPTLGDAASTTLWTVNGLGGIGFAFTPSSGATSGFRWTLRHSALWVTVGSPGTIDRILAGEILATSAGFGSGKSVLTMASDGDSLFAVLNSPDGGTVHELDATTLAPIGTFDLPEPYIGGTYGDEFVLLMDAAGVLFVAGNFQIGVATSAGQFYRRDGTSWTLLNADLGPHLTPSSQSGTILDRLAVYNNVLYRAELVATPPDFDGAPIYRSNTLPQTDVEPPALSDVVTRLCERTGLLTAADVDVTDLEDLVVRALAVSQVGPTRATLEVLMVAYLFECVEAEKLRFVARGGSSVATIPYEDLGASAEGDAEPLPKRRLDDIEIAAQVTVKFANVENDFQNGAETGDRLVTESTAVSVVELPIGFTPGEAKRLADANTMDLAVSLVQIGPIALPRKYAALEPTDVVTLTAADGSTFRARIVKATLGGGISACETVLDDATAINSLAETDEDYSSSHLVRVIGDSVAVPIDSPLLRDPDEGPGFYMGVETTGLFPGAEVDVSPDDVTYTKVLDITDRTVLGVAGAALGDFAGGTVFDELNFLTVDVGEGTLSSATRDQLLQDDANAMLVGAEVIQFRMASLVSPGVYTLSGLLRGRRGTEWAIPGHGAGERVVRLQLTGLRRVPEQAADIGIERFWKAITYGKSKGSAEVVPFTDTGVSLKPFSPVDARASKASSGDVTLTWKRRTRMHTRFCGTAGINVPLGEAVESYVIQIFEDDSFTLPVKRELFAGAEEVLYSTADQVVDFGALPAELSVRIMQLSAVVGRGYPLEATLLLDDRSAFAPDLSVTRPVPIVLASTGTAWLLARQGTAYPGGRALGFYAFEEGGDATLIGNTLSSSGFPYLLDLHLEARDTATERFVLLMRSYANQGSLRKLFFGDLPGAIKATVPTFMPATPPFALWWAGTEFRVLLTDGHVWSSADGESWADEGAATGAPSTTASSLSVGAVVVVGSVLAMKFENTVLTCADTDGMAWTAATGDVDPLPTSTYSDSLVLAGIASNGARAVITAYGKKPGDSSSYGLVYSTTDGEDWDLEYEEAVGTSAYRHSPQLNGGLIEFDGNFLADMWPLVPGTSNLDVLPILTFADTSTLTFADRESCGRANDNGAVAADPSSPDRTVFFTADLATRDPITWTEG